MPEDKPIDQASNKDILAQVWKDHKQDYTAYIDMIDGRLRTVRCMKCNVFLYDMGDPISLRNAEQAKLPHHIPMLLSDGSYTDLVLCHACDVTESDIPKLERTVKYGWLYEVIKMGRPLDQVLKLAQSIEPLKILRRKI